MKVEVVYKCEEANGQIIHRPVEILDVKQMEGDEFHIRLWNTDDKVVFMIPVSQLVFVSSLKEESE